MSAQSNANDEIDLFFLFKKIKGAFKSIIIAGFRGVDFLIRNWLILLILAIVGAIAGYFLTDASQEKMKSKAIVQINFEAVDYVYDAINVLNGKIIEEDSVFLRNNGFKLKELSKLEISPIVDVTGVINQYENNSSYRILETLFKNLTIEEEDVAIENFFTNRYKKFEIDLVFSSKSTNQTIDKFITYLNSNPLYNDFKAVALENYKEHIKFNDKAIQQIDNSISSYSNSDFKENQIFIDKDLNGLFKTKRALQLDSELVKSNIVLEQDIVVVLNKPTLTKVDTGVSKNKMVKYPFILISIFILGAVLINVYRKTRNFVLENE